MENDVIYIDIEKMMHTAQGPLKLLVQTSIHLGELVNERVGYLRRQTWFAVGDSNIDEAGASPQFHCDRLIQGFHYRVLPCFLNREQKTGIFCEAVRPGHTLQ